MKVHHLLDFKQARIRTLHYAWIAFFITFCIWFSIPPLASTMLKKLDWLTPEHIKILAIANVALTIPARILIGSLIDRFGPRKIYSGLLIFISIPTILFAFGDSFTQMLILRLVLSSVGAGFVIGIRLVADWFPPKAIGFAEGFYGGWGNFGSAFAAMTLPWIALTLFGSFEDGWRYAIALNGLVALVYGIIFYANVRDTPEGKVFHGSKKTQPLLATSWGDLVQLVIWSFPLTGALGLLAWRLSNIKIGGTEKFISEEVLYAIWAGLAILYAVHMFLTLRINIPLLKKGFSQKEKYHFGSVAALNTTYFANFGAELAVVSMLPLFFEKTFSISATQAGLVASSFAFVNLFARPLGGILSDKFGNRKTTMMIYMLGIAIGFFGMSLINASWSLWLAVAVTILCSIFVQGAEGATFAVIPFVNRKMTGKIAGMAGAYGNVGAVVYLTIYSMVDDKTFFQIVATGAFVSFLACLALLKEPKGSFSEEYIEHKEVAVAE